MLSSSSVAAADNGSNCDPVGVCAAFNLLSVADAVAEALNVGVRQYGALVPRQRLPREWALALLRQHRLQKGEKGAHTTDANTAEISDIRETTAMRCCKLTTDRAQSQPSFSSPK